MLFISGAAAGGAAALGFLAEELVVDAQGQHSEDEDGDYDDGSYVGVVAFDAAPHCYELLCFLAPVVLKDAEVHDGFVGVEDGVDADVGGVFAKEVAQVNGVVGVVNLGFHH